MEGLPEFSFDDDKNDASTSMDAKNSYNEEMNIDALINMALNYEGSDLESLCTTQDGILPGIFPELDTEFEVNECPNETQLEIIGPQTKRNMNHEDVNKEHSSLKQSKSGRFIPMNSKRSNVPPSVKSVSKLKHKLSNIKIHEHTPDMHMKCILNLPPLQADECYICLKIGTDFSDIYVGSWRKRVEYHLLVKIIGYAQKQNKNIKMSYQNRELIIYALPGDTENIYFGPYKIYSAIDLTLFQAINGRLLLREDYLEKYVKEPKDLTYAFKIVNIDSLKVNEIPPPRESTEHELKKKPVLKRRRAYGSSKYSAFRSSRQANTIELPAAKSAAPIIEPKLEDSLVHATPTSIAPTYSHLPDIIIENIGLKPERPTLAAEAINKNKTRTNSTDVMINSECFETRINSAMTGDDENSRFQVVDDLMDKLETGYIISDVLQLGRLDATRSIYGQIIYKKPMSDELEIVDIANINETFTDYIKSLVYAVIPDTFNFNWRFETNPDIAKIYKVHNRDLFNEGMVLELLSPPLHR